MGKNKYMLCLLETQEMQFFKEKNGKIHINE